MPSEPDHRAPSALIQRVAWLRAGPVSKAGTLVADDVHDLDAHQRRICDPNGYRPDRCPRCGHDVLHVHCYPEQHPRAEPGISLVAQVAQYMCAAAEVRRDVAHPADCSWRGTCGGHGRRSKCVALPAWSRRRTQLRRSLRGAGVAGAPDWRRRPVC